MNAIEIGAAAFDALVETYGHVDNAEFQYRISNYWEEPEADLNMESCLWALIELAGESVGNAPDIMIVNARMVMEDAADEDGPWDVDDFPYMAVVAAVPLSTETSKDTCATAS